MLAVGDAAFQQKCFDEFHRLRDEGKTMLFVTHDMGAVVRFCHRAMLLERGRVRLIGEPDEVASQYLEANFNRAEAEAERRQARRIASATAGREIVDAWFEDQAASPRSRSVRAGMRLPRARRASTSRVVNPIFGVGFENAEKQYVFATNSTLVQRGHRHVRGRLRGRVPVRLENVFASGRIFATPAVAHEGGGGHGSTGASAWSPSCPPPRAASARSSTCRTTSDPAPAA